MQSPRRSHTEGKFKRGARDARDADNSVVSKSRPVPPTRSERKTRRIMDNGERLHRSPRVVSRDALPSRKAKAECARVWAGEMPGNIPGHAPGARALHFAIADGSPGIFIRSTMERFSRARAAFEAIRG